MRLLIIQISTSVSLGKTCIALVYPFVCLEENMPGMEGVKPYVLFHLSIQGLLSYLVLLVPTSAQLK